MTGKRKLGFFILAAVIIVTLLAVSAAGRHKEYSGTFLQGGDEVGNLYKTREESVGSGAQRA